LICCTGGTGFRRRVRARAQEVDRAVTRLTQNLRLALGQLRRQLSDISLVSEGG